MKISTKVLLIILLLAIILGFTGFDAFYIAPSRFKVRYETLSSINIPEQLNDINILYFSDLDYGEFMDEKRASQLVEKINNVSADVVIFGGDLFSDKCDINDDNISILTNLLKNIEAPLGKFAIYGDFDELNEDRKNAINSIYNASDFEILNNKSITLHNKGTNSITLVGIDNGINGTINIDETFSSVSRETYVLAIVHIPDTASLLPSDIVDYCLSGHSLGGQVYYGFGALYIPDGSTNYYRSKNDLGSFTLDISNGTGTLNHDVRFFSDAEIVVYRLKSKAVETVAPTLETNNEEQTEEVQTPIVEEQPVETPIIEEEVTEIPIVEEEPSIDEQSDNIEG